MISSVLFTQNSTILYCSSSSTSKFAGKIDKIENSDIELLGSYKLMQNYPNPFNPTTKISFDLPKNVHIKLTVYDILGEKISTLINKNLDAGNHSVEFNPSQLGSGIYFYTLQAGNFIQTKKMILLR